MHLSEINNQYIHLSSINNHAFNFFVLSFFSQLKSLFENFTFGSIKNHKEPVRYPGLVNIRLD
jgi:hypothetical protein